MLFMVSKQSKQRNYKREKRGKKKTTQNPKHSKCFTAEKIEEKKIKNLNCKS